MENPSTWDCFQHQIFCQTFKVQAFSTSLTAPTLAQQTQFSLAAGMLTIRDGQIKLPNESRLVSIYSLVSSAGNTNSLKSHYKWESVCANIACVNPKICQFLFKKKFGFNLDQ